MLLWPRSWSCSPRCGWGTVGYQRMEMAELLLHPLVPALCPFGAQSTQKNLLLCRHAGSSACHSCSSLLHPSAADSSVLNHALRNLASLLLCTPASADEQTVPGWQQEPTHQRSPEPSRERKYREGSWETLLGGMWGNAFSDTHDISQLTSFYSLSAWKFPCMGKEHGNKFPSPKVHTLHSIYCPDQ